MLGLSLIIVWRISSKSTFQAFHRVSSRISRDVRQITASLSFTRVCPCHPTHTHKFSLSQITWLLFHWEKRRVAKMFSQREICIQVHGLFFSLHYERKEKCYSLDGVVTSHNKPSCKHVYHWQRTAGKSCVAHHSYHQSMFGCGLCHSPFPPNFPTWVQSGFWVLWKVGDKPMGAEYAERRTESGGEAADRSTKWKKVIPVLVFG